MVCDTAALPFMVRAKREFTFAQAPLPFNKPPKTQIFGGFIFAELIS
jgi:hypothetical protein